MLFCTSQAQRPAPNRREVIVGATSLVDLAGAALLGPSSALASQPKTGGTLRVGLGHGSISDSLDPATWNNYFMQAAGFARCNCLTEIAPDGTLVPELAESWESPDGGKTWVFKLRSGVEFHNGKTFDASDVIATINHHRKEESKSAAKPSVTQIEELKLINPSTIAFMLKSTNADFPFVLADFHLVILPSVDGSLDWQSGVGTGGYELVDTNPGVSASFIRNAKYWKPNSAYFDALKLLTIADSAARTNALMTGEIDVMDKVDLKTANLLERRNGIRIIETLGTQHFSFAMSTNKEPFTDNNVRLALKYAIDRQALVDTILYGHGVVGNDHPINRSYRFFNADLEQHAYDPERAKYHLKKSGLSSLTVSLSAADAAFSGAVDAAVLYQEKAAKAGITIDVVKEPDDGYWANVWMKKSFSAVFWGGRPTEDWVFSTTYAAGAPWNDTFWENSRFNELLVGARSELNDEKRRQMYGEMQELLRNDGGALIPMFANYVSAAVDRVKLPEQTASNWYLDGFRFSERWWFE